MGYSILSQNGNNSSYVTNLIVDDLAGRDAIDVNSISPGSEVYVESEQVIYILDTNREWQLKVNGGGGGGTSYSAGKNINISSDTINLDIPVIESSEEDSVNNGLYFAEIASSTAGTGYATQQELNNLSQQVENMGSSIKTEEMLISYNDTSENISITNEKIRVSNGSAMTVIEPTLITANNFSKYRIGNTVALPNTSGTLVVDTDLQEIYDRLAQIEAKLS